MKQLELPFTRSQAELKKKLLTSLSKEEYEAAPVPSREKIRAALKAGSDDLYKARLAKRKGPGRY